MLVQVLTMNVYLCKNVCIKMIYMLLCVFVYTQTCVISIYECLRFTCVSVCICIYIFMCGSKYVYGLGGCVYLYVYMDEYLYLCIRISVFLYLYVLRICWSLCEACIFMFVSMLEREL